MRLHKNRVWQQETYRQTESHTHTHKNGKTTTFKNFSFSVSRTRCHRFCARLQQRQQEQRGTQQVLEQSHGQWTRVTNQSIQFASITKILKNLIIKIQVYF